VVASLSLPVGASEGDVHEATIAVERRVERAVEKKLVEELLTAAAKTDQAVVGLDATIDAMRESRIWKLVYAEAVSARGGECSKCSALFVEEHRTCAYCRGKVQRLDDLVARLVERTLDLNGKFEQVRGEAAERLRQAGGVGAFLRY
jgi:peptide subunit release factor 1 (eRF1)